jgi:hypothetical protein
MWHRPAFLRERSQRGQAMVETAMILPLLLLIVIGTLEFGMAFDHNLSIEYATREGARTGAALANGGGPLGCGSGQSPNAANVDPAIIAAVERVLTSPGSPLRMEEVSEIRIYKANASGKEPPGGPVNVWTYAAGAGPIVGGAALDFVPVAGQQSWPACSRTNGANPDYVGVSLRYRYRMQTPLGSMISMFEIHMQDRTVMSLNPTNQ